MGWTRLLSMVTSRFSLWSVGTQKHVGLQILPDWQEYFGHPEGQILGLISSAQNIGALVVRETVPHSIQTLIAIF